MNEEHSKELSVVDSKIRHIIQSKDNSITLLNNKLNHSENALKVAEKALNDLNCDIVVVRKLGDTDNVHNKRRDVLF